MKPMKSKECKKALLDSEERFRILTETTDSAIFAFRDTILYVNPALLALTGYSKEELLNKNIDLLFQKSFIDRINDFSGQKYFDSIPRFKQEIQIYNKKGAPFMATSFYNINATKKAANIFCERI